MADRLGYRPHAVARSLSRRQTMAVGVVVTDLGNPVFAPILRGVANKLEESNYIALMTETQDDHKRLATAIERLLERRVEALIVGAVREGDNEVMQTAIDDGVPVVLAVRSLAGSALPTVTTDDLAGGYLAATYLADLGHKRVAEIAGPQDVQPFNDRSRGFARGAADRGLVVSRLVTAPSEQNTVGGGHAVEEVMAASGTILTAIFAHTDSMAIGALAALRRLGFECPGDVSVLGYNNAPFVEHAHPPLSTIGFPAERIGESAAELALELINNPARIVGSVSFPPTLVVRESAAPPRLLARV
jgi:LacI family transcriptional regulator